MALSFTHPFQQAGMHGSQVKFRTISSREKLIYKKLIINIKNRIIFPQKMKKPCLNNLLPEHRTKIFLN